MVKVRGYLLGIDGGGTECRARLCDVSGRLLGVGTAGPATLRLGADVVWTSVMAAARSAIGAAAIGDEATIDVAIGVAGTSRRDALLELLAMPHGFASLAIVSDALIACIGAHGRRDGGVVIAGTGSIGFGVTAGREVRIGGYGFPASDEGGGAYIGLRAMCSALRALDGRDAMTPMTQQILQRFNNDPAQMIAWVDQASPTMYAALVPVIVEAATAGDGTAIALLADAAQKIGALARDLHALGVLRICVLGGLVSVLEPWLLDIDGRVPPMGDSVDGALTLARQAASSRG